MDNQITIKKENILNAYNQATDEQKELLENVFGKDMFQPQNIEERVKTFVDVFQMLCNVNGPLPSVEEQGKVIKIIQDTKDKINELINKKL